MTPVRRGHTFVVAQADDISIRLDSDLSAPLVARRFVEENSDHLPVELVADAELLVSELVSNAIRHGQPQIVLRVSLEPPLMGVLVRDEGTDLPTTDVHMPSPDDVGGRGLLIIDRLSSQWGVIPHAPAAGKTVWFELSGRDY